MGEHLRFTGELSITMVDRLQADLLQALQNRQPVTIDLDAVERIDTAALQLLLAVQREASSAGIPLTFCCPSQLQRRFKSLGISLC